VTVSQSWWGDDDPKDVLAHLKELREKPELRQGRSKASCFIMGYTVSERIEAAQDLYRATLNTIYLDIIDEAEKLQELLET